MNKPAFTTAIFLMFLLGGCTLPSWILSTGTPAAVILPTATMNPADLEGITWLLQTAGEYRLSEGSHFTIRFSDGVVEGDAGCHGFRGAYQADGDHIEFPTFNLLGETSCNDEGLLAQEKIYTDYLKRVNRYWVSRSRLELYTVDGAVLLFVAD